MLSGGFISEAADAVSDKGTGAIRTTDVQTYVGYLESKERLRIQPAQLFHFS